MELAFVLGRRQNGFFVEIVEAIRDELAQAGVPSSVHWDGFPREREELVYVLVPPHEWFSLERHLHEPTASQLARTIFICAEQPGTAFFSDDLTLGHMAGAVFDINAGSVHAFAEEGLPGVRHFPLGWTRTWDHVELDGEGLPAAGMERDIDVLHLGTYSGRRGRALAASGRWLSQWRCRLVLADDDQPNSAQSENFVSHGPKWDLMRRSRILLNVHVAERPYFEWLRVVQAISCGCAVVSEHSVGVAPLQSGRELLLGRTEALGLMAQDLLRDEGRRLHMARTAYWHLRKEMPFAASVADLVEVAEEIVDRRRRSRRISPRALPPLLVGHVPEIDSGGPTQFPQLTIDPDAAALRAALKETRLEVLELRREVHALAQPDAVGRPRVELDDTSRAYGAEALISVIIPLYNYAHHIEAALASVQATRRDDIELVVVDDGSSDQSLAVARRFMARNEGTPMALVRHPVNRGLGHARNTALDFARGTYAFMLDADNEVYPQALGRLLEALEGDEAAAASYGMLEQFSSDGAVGLVSVYPWRPERLRTGNFVDAMALWRTARLRDLGGFTTDRRLHGWEDYDLWCRLAESGGHAVLVPEILARYRVTKHSMLSLTNISSRSAVSVLIERYPRVMAGVEPPL